MSEIKIVIVDDHSIVREGLKLIFEFQPDFKVVGEAADGREALAVIDTLQPDVILMDMSMPNMTGLEAMRILKEQKNRIPIVVLTTYNEAQLISEALTLGAKGYLTKNATRHEMIRTIEAAVRGETLLQPEIMQALLTNREKGALESIQYDRPMETNLTEREQFVLHAIARGCTSREIALDMAISERTVKAHLTNIYAKLGVESRSEAVAVSMRRGLVHGRQ